MGALFLYLDSTKCAIKVSVLCRNGTKLNATTINVLVPGPHTFLLLEPVPVLGEAAETIWRRVNMAIVKSSLRFTTIVQGSFVFSFKKSPFTLEFQMPRGQKVSRLLATSFKILVANTQFLVALATSQSQFRTLPLPYNKAACSPFGTCSWTKMQESSINTQKRMRPTSIHLH